MNGCEGSLALKLDFGDLATKVTSTGGHGRARLKLAQAGVDPARSDPDKYRALDRQRRAAQIRARHLLDLIDGDRQNAPGTKVCR